MPKLISYPGQLVFGLDIGTRSIVGTLGYRNDNMFYVVAQETREHLTRAMMDGQIHDIEKVGNTIKEVKNALEERTGRKLLQVCIAAAGRVLETVSVHVKLEYDQERTITSEDVYALNSLGVEMAYEDFNKENKAEEKYYCVGYSAVHYYMNGYLISNLENHKARVIEADLIATFLPDDVVDGLSKAVSIAGLEVANLTLEPIAAIQLAIPENYRMLNIALVDVGAGTSDISITKDGSIIAYGMLPIAGDALTEAIARHCLVEFATAEKIKCGIMNNEVVEYEDIMLLPQQITRQDVLSVSNPIVENMTKSISEKIIELNGGKPTSAVFVVGGGGKIENFTQLLADKLGIPKERVAIRGKEVMQSIVFLQEGIEKDSLLVTPIGICLNFYEQNNSFIYVSFNGNRIKLYDNNKLSVADAALQAEFPKEALFPRRGKELNFTVNGKSKIVRGFLGETAELSLNGEKADIYSSIHANDIIEVKESTIGREAECEIRNLSEYGSNLNIIVNKKRIEMPRAVYVNKTLQSEYYSIVSQDQVEIANYYTVEQILKFMDIILEDNINIYVNNEIADITTKVYENFSVVWEKEDHIKADVANSYEELTEEPDEASYEASYEETDEETDEESYEDFYEKKDEESEKAELRSEDESLKETLEKSIEKVVINSNEATQKESVQNETAENEVTENEATEIIDAQKVAQEQDRLINGMDVIVNKCSVHLSNKKNYVFVDIFELIDFDLSKVKGSGLVTIVNGSPAQYLEPLKSGDVIEVYWKE